MEEVILVNEMDEQVGVMEKMRAHETAVLHRAFSVFIFNADNKMLLQRRALSKYHSGGLWTNACCSHPKPGEETLAAANRRLKEELGFNTDLRKIFDFVYKAEFENGLTEYEFDHVFIGRYDDRLEPNPDEVMDVSFMDMNEIMKSLEKAPQDYTAWFYIAFPKVYSWWLEENK